MYQFFVFLTLLITHLAFSAEIKTNEVVFSNAPAWVTSSKVNQVVSQIQNKMEWDIRQVKVIWYDSQSEFQKFHGFDSTVLAVSQKPAHTIHIGPRVTLTNFEPVFGHELVHIILFQKYKDAIPKWLEEGLANFISKHGKVDYKWLSSQSTKDVRTLIHPFIKMGDLTSNSTTPNSRYHYQASTGLIEMIASKCSLSDILQLSVGEKLESYLSTFCGISDINSDFQNWIKRKSKNL